MFSSMGNPGGGGGLLLPVGEGSGGSAAKALIMPNPKIIKEKKTILKIFINL